MNVKITVVKDWRGQEEVHAAGCADLKRRNRPYRLAEALTMDAETLGDLYATYWDCIADEQVYDGSSYATLEEVWWAWRGEFDVKPCAKALPEMPEPGCRYEEGDGRVCIGVAGLAKTRRSKVPSLETAGRSGQTREAKR